MVSGGPTGKLNEFDELVAEYSKRMDIYYLSIGTPGITPPKCAIEKFIEELKGCGLECYRYTHGAGLEDLRSLIIEDIAESGGPKLDLNELVLTAGGQHSILVSLMAILNRGDEVVLLDPAFMAYETLTELAGAKLRRVPRLYEEGFKVDVEALKENIVRGRTKAIVVVTPDNPTGVTLSKEEAKAIADLAVDAGSWIVADEAYWTIVYEGEHVWTYNYAPDNTIGVYTFSKDPGLPGWRLGYVYARSDAARVLKRLVEETVYSPPLAPQLLVRAYLSDRECKNVHRCKMLTSYDERRKVFVKSLDEELPGYRASYPRGAFFVMLKAPKGVDGEKAARALLEVGVATVPGSLFGESARNYLRLSFAREPADRLKEAVRRIASVYRRLGG